MTTLEALFIDCSRQWEAVYSGALTEEDISDAWHRMMRQRYEADIKNLPGGLRQRKDLLRLAEREASAYFNRMYRTAAANAGN